MKDIEVVWQYSRYYGDMLATVERLHAEEEDYAALMILFNAMELICKSVRNNYNQNFTQDLNYLKDKGLLTEEDWMFLDQDDSSVRKIRNIMTHRNAYQYCLENDEGIALPFAETETWKIIYSSYAQKILNILVKIVESQLIIDKSIDR